MGYFIEQDLDNIDFGEYDKLAGHYLQALFPINRSILNKGVPETLSILKDIVDFEIIKLPTGYRCYDWTIPEEWDVSEAYIEVDGQKIIDFQNNNLHVLNYSEPVNKLIDYGELSKHLYYSESLPDAIPYKTAYYKRDWGFCMSFKQFLTLDKSKKYLVKINSQHQSGSLNIAERVLKGESDKEILISSYICHPSLANDNLSGVIMWAMLLKFLEKQKLKYSYRFVLLPETIGSIAYLKMREKKIKAKVIGGFVLTTCGGPGKIGYKYSFLGNSLIDKCVEMAFGEKKMDFIKYPFDISGSDERQYSSPYFRIPCGTITKDKYYEYEEYHTSLDNLEFVKPEFIKHTFLMYLSSLQNIELHDLKYKSLNPAGEPFLTKRNLYSTVGITINNKLKRGLNHSKTNYKIADEQSISGQEIDLILWLMFWSDGKKSLIEIAILTNQSIKKLYKVAKQLEIVGLIRRL